MTYASNSKSRHTAFSLSLAIGLSLAGGALFGACNTYDPDLGETPFRCGLDNPRCPDGYECVTYSAAEEICQFIGEDPAIRADGGGAGDLVCNNDSELEPNESISDPTLTGIPNVQTFARYVVAICPSSDQDFFRFEVLVDTANVTAEVEYLAGRGLLSLNILTVSGVSIGTGLPVGDNANILRATMPNLAIGIYYAQVRSGEAGAQNNYSIEIITD
ncbi:MAG: hypothetical protein GY811_30650 [Myxococcales bacterium]|nr:hypothetical protein [Myxococcales bacterium]